MLFSSDRRFHEFVQSLNSRFAFAASRWSKPNSACIPTLALGEPSGLAKTEFGEAFDGYASCTKADWAGVLQFVSIASQIDGRSFFQSSIETHTNLDDQTFRASIAATTLTGDHARIYVSAGLLKALDDVFLRLCCNLDFFSDDMRPNGSRLWNSCECIFPGRVIGLAKPHNRYWDYSPELLVSGEMVTQISLWPLLFSGVPFGDPSRIDLAAMLSLVARAWILMHEESHLRLGHLAYLSHKKSRGMDLIEIGLDETDGTTSLEDITENKVMEWHADRGATNAIVDMFLEKAFIQRLPKYCRRDPLWLVRLITTAIATTILLFDRARQIRGSSSLYPDPLARFAAAFVAVQDRILKRPENLKLLNLRREQRSDYLNAMLELTSGPQFSSYCDALVAAEIFENENTEGNWRDYVDPFPASVTAALPPFLKLFEAVSKTPEVFSEMRRVGCSDTSSMEEGALTMEHAEIARAFDNKYARLFSTFRPALT